MSTAAARAAKRWSCPVCSAVTSGQRMEQLETYCTRFRRTRRPSPSQLEELLGEAAQLRVQPPEEAQLRRALRDYRRWEASARRLLVLHENLVAQHRAEQARLPPPPPPPPQQQPSSAAAPARRAAVPSAAALAVSARCVREVVKQGCVCELDAGEVADAALSLLRQEAWRSRAAPLVRAVAAAAEAGSAGGEGGAGSKEGAEGGAAEGAKFSMDVLTRLLTEADAADLPPADPLLTTLLAHHTAARDWLDTCATLMRELRAAAGREVVGPELQQLLSRARAHVQVAARLPVLLEKEVERLLEVSSVYCLCRRLYDEDEPMLGCDYCEEWYHFSCVGLRRPPSSAAVAADDDEDE
ncbi:hypothetical protein Agub_g4710, partial [Astrephomene gubernaculifera]